MKPNKLVLENIGPFTEKTEIDFSELGSMFLICGDTGAGKTTILDSICYALYGALPGSHPRMARNLRSDFAPKSEIARVIFDFSINGARYKVERTPPKPYTDRNGKESEKPAEVVLYKLANGAGQTTNGAAQGESWAVLYNKTQEADEAIASLIGLSIKEFSKIVLLPQGDFAEFLRLSSNERKNALAKLFPIDDYRLITEFAKSKVDEFVLSQKQITAQIESMQKTFDFEHAEENIAALEQTEKRYGEELAEINKLQMQLAAQLENARALNQKFDDLAALNAENTEVLAQQGEIESIESKLEQSRKAFLVKPAFESFNDLQSRLESSAENLAQTENELAEAEAEKQKLEDGKAAFEEKKAQVENMPSLISDLNRAAAIENDLTVLSQDLNLETARKDQLSEKLDKIKNYLDTLKKEAAGLEAVILPQDELDEAFDKANSELDEAKAKKNYLEEYQKLLSDKAQAKEGLDASFARYENAKKSLELLKTEIAELEAEQSAYDQNQKAFALAKDLQEGEPCPVCGSVHHPKLADFLSEDFSIEERLRCKKENLSQAESLERETFGIYAGVKSRYEDIQAKLDNAEKPDENAPDLFNQAVQKKNDAVAKRDKNKQNNNRLAENRRKEENNRKEFEFVQNELQTSLQKYASLDAEYKNMKSQFNSLTQGKLKPEETAAIAVESYRQQLVALRTETASYERQCGEVQKLINEYSAKKGLIFKQTEELREQSETSAEKLKQQLLAHGFDSAETLQAAFLSEDERVKLENQCKDWKARKEQLAGLIDKLSAELDGTARPDIAALEAESENVTAGYQQKTKELNEIVLKKHEVAENLKRWQDLNKERQNIEEKSRNYVALAKDLAGDNAKKISFESWILGVYLEEIAAHASRRLSRISDGRYSLHLKTERSSGHQRYAGLDLEIFDANTGKKRPCDTLSGGETFFVSISLALALTDVVQSRSGGVQLDSLFIDEGFGSLDDTTLEKALSVLDEIRENRMIGIISHVGELRTRIHHRIEVTKTPNGSTLSVIGE